MRGVGLIAACMGLALSAAGHAAERASQQPAVLKDYVGLICAQVQVKPGATCNGKWALFVQAGMNDIDLRCTRSLDRLGAGRDGKPEADPQSLDLVAKAFGLTGASPSDWSSPLLSSVGRPAIEQTIVPEWMKLRLKIKDTAVPDQASAIRLLRDYAQVCAPATIEASINKAAAPGRASPQ